MKHILLFILFCFGLKAYLWAQTPIPVQGQEPEVKFPSAEFIHLLNDELTKIISYDKFTPPPASRIYTYPNIAAFELLAAYYPSRYQSLSGQLNELKPCPSIPIDKKIDFGLALTEVFLKVGGHVVWNTLKFQQDARKRLEPYLKSNLDPIVKENTLDYAKKLSDHIIAWADQDRYKQRTAFARYTIKKLPHTWEPTPPAFMEAIEPNWKSIRPFVMKKADEIQPEPMHPFSLDTNSLFWKELMEVYLISKNHQISKEEEDMAWFWDDNCKATQMQGHFMQQTFKQTPVGHWVFITREVCRLKDVPLEDAIESYALISIAVADGVIACWAEKYRSELIRPITLIQRHIDKQWIPILETPYFPEYPSGHGVISGAAARVLAWKYGDNITFTDSSTLSYGRQPRVYHSLTRAAYEASLSRLYGGIHYRKGCEAGHRMGLYTGEAIMTRLTTRRKKN